MLNYFKKSIFLFALIVGLTSLAQIVKAMEALVRDEIETSSIISSFKPCFIKMEKVESVPVYGGGRQTVTRNSWLIWSKDKGEMVSNLEQFVPRSSNCPLMGHCSVHDLTELERYKTRLIEIQKNLEPYRSEQKKKEEILDLEIQIKKMKLQKLIDAKKEN